MTRFHDEFFKQKGTKHDELMFRCTSEEMLERIVAAGWASCKDILPDNPTSLRPTPEMVYETEQIVKNGTFIIGYVDMVIDVTYPDCAERTTYNLHKSRWETSEPGDFSFRVYVEAKPTITDVGAVMRQLKTYRATYRQVNRHEAESGMVIVTTTPLQDDAIQFLDHEGIGVITSPPR